MLHLAKHPIQAALFDLDGTLVHTQIDFALMRTEMRRIAREAGISLENIPDGEILEIVRAATQQVEPSAAKALRDAMWGRLEEIERDGAISSSIIRGADLLLDRLRQAGVKVGVVTRNCRAVSSPLLAQFGLICDVLLTRDDIERAKPDPAHLLAALEVLNVPASAAVMVGDHWLDIQAGQEAGCAATIGVLGPTREASWFDCHRPTYIVRDLAEAEALFTSHNLTGAHSRHAYPAG